MRFCERIGPVLADKPATFSSTGIDMYYALTLGYQITGREELKSWIFAGGDNFVNIFDHRAQAFMQIAGADRIVIDTGLNLPSMLWASQWEPKRAVLAYRHLDTVLEVGLVREDGSNCQAAALDPNTRAVAKLFSLQGWRDDSVWARGQGWAILNFAHGYEASGNPRYLDAARRAADWYVEHTPPGWVPHYDYDDPERESLPFDSCAAGIATANLLRLARWLPERADRYRWIARETLKALISNFLTPGGVLLHGTWGRMRHVESGKPRLGRFPQEDVMPYGNYWIAECLFRELSDDWSVLALNENWVGQA
jgi:unsaturated chondroitin disaccharide hydrolase